MNDGIKECRDGVLGPRVPHPSRLTPHEALDPFACASMSSCKTLESSPLSEKGVRNQADSFPPAPTGEVQARQQPKAQPPP